VLDKRSELELKLLVPSDFQLPPLAGESPDVAGVSEKEPLQLSAVYFDTPDLRLLRHGITLRYRTGEDGGPRWTLKLPVNGDNALRSELEYAGNGTEPPAEARTVLFGVLNGSVVGPVAEIKTRRRRWSLAGPDGEEMAELVDDRVSVLDGNEIRDSFREIEIESHGASRKVLERIARVIRDAGAMPEQRSKASRALEALRGAAPTVAPHPLDPDEPAGHAVGPALEDALARLLMYDPYARIGEVEGVHQLRVAGRVVRSVLRTFDPLLDQQKLAAAHEELRWLGQALGGVRDLDVMIEGLREAAGAAEQAIAPVLSTLAARRAEAEVVLTQALASERYAGMIKMLSELAHDDTFVVVASGPAETELPALAQRMWNKLRKAADALEPVSPEANFHRARILAKRARYAAETVGQFVSSKPAKRLHRLAVAAESVQNVLGEHMDATFARETLEGFASAHHGDGAVSFQLGRMVERYDQVARQKRREFFKLWRKLGRGRNLG
jgi:CHAD domain-containing protein